MESSRRPLPELYTNKMLVMVENLDTRYIIKLTSLIVHLTNHSFIPLLEHVGVSLTRHRSCLRSHRCLMAGDKRIPVRR